MPAQHLIHKHYEARSLIEIDLTADKSLDISDHPSPVTMMMKPLSSSMVVVVTSTPTNSTTVAVNGSSSPIANLKRLHGWITWQLIRLFTKGGEEVLDLACGKGGDLRKWDKARAGLYVGVDMVPGLLDAAHHRYVLLGCKFSARFVCGDAYSGSLLKDMAEDITTTTTTATTTTGDSKTKKTALLFDVVSCQFALHYAWSSEERARAAMQNVAASLKPGGFFIGTIPDADAIVEKLRASAAMVPDYDEIDCCVDEDDNIFSCEDDDDDDDDDDGGDQNCDNATTTSALIDCVRDTRSIAAGRVVEDGFPNIAFGGGSCECGKHSQHAEIDPGTDDLITFGNRVYHLTFTKENCKRVLDLYGRTSPKTDHPPPTKVGGGGPGMATQAQAQGPGPISSSSSSSSSSS